MSDRHGQAGIVDKFEGLGDTIEEVFAGRRVVKSWMIVRRTHTWHPPTDVFEQNGKIVVLVEVAGMQDGEFTVTLHERHLAITGVRRYSNTERPAYYQMEVRYGQFRTDVELPCHVDRNGVTATYHDGFLRVELPRASAERIQVVDVGRDEE